MTSGDLQYTSGPGAALASQLDTDMPASHPQGKAKRRNRIIHSCLECRRRKMKCDKETPCTNCNTAGRDCEYVRPASKPGFREKLVEMKDAKDALDSAVLGTYRESRTMQARSHSQTEPVKRHRSTPILSDDDDDDGGDSSGDNEYLEPTPLAVDDAAYGDDIDDEADDLGVRIGRMCLSERIGGLYRPRISDEISSSLGRNDLGRPPYSFKEPSHRTTLVPSDAILFSYGDRVDLRKYLPDRHISDSLLQRYWAAVHPVARIVHRPSFAQRYETLWECVENGLPIPPSLAGIICAILLSAVISMSESETSDLGSGNGVRQALLDQLKQGTEAALSQCKLLRTSKVESVQALVAYMLPMCLDQISRAHSVLAGLLVRLAECMGLHRDPTEFGFSATECHSRRLIWYQVCYIDLKTSFLQGPRPFVHHDGYTTQLPLDVSLDLTPNQGQLPWNDMIFTMIRFEWQRMQRRCFTHRKRVDQRRMTLTQAISKIEQFRVNMDTKYGPYLYCASPSPVQRMAGLVLKIWLGMMYLYHLHRYMNSVTYRLPDRLRQIVLIKGTEMLEAAVELQSAPELEKWAWYSPAYQQYHTAFLLLVEVFKYPRRREASRVWKCLDFIFEEPLASLPPLNVAVHNSTLDKIINHRNVKARYLLTVISDSMRDYNETKRSKLPSHFNESMIGNTPEKPGDDLDPRLPMNYAHGEPETASAEVESTGLCNGKPTQVEYAHSYVHTSSSEPDANVHTGYSNSVPLLKVPYTGDNAWPPSSGQSSLWPMPGMQDSDRHSVPNLGLTHLYPADGDQYHNQSMSEVATASTSQRGSSGGDAAMDAIDPQVLDIDWNLWDTIFPPQINHGELDISDGYMWETNAPYHPSYTTFDHS
ncbi:hypothetical protein FE257_005784 [Aspergillus nanangensis]|uniref:Zn(2)-C6 fungal-type domain-containing protein n=1 Tax=Aspergillus nanangensis TaxID=2582783 RepID=A0AAD4GWM3_ASPNN|nr:hypothetical protein FE257_005784 [Aspergillus nanangensis]